MEEFAIRIDGPIGEGLFSEGVTVQTVRGLLAGRESEDVTVWINSPGGDVIEGSAIYTALKEHKGKVTVKIDGIAASAASVIAMGGDEVLMSPSSYLMIHRASTIAWGNVDEMDEASRQLQAVDEGLIDVYQARTHLSRNKIREMLEQETFLNSSAAVKLGFADGVLYSDKPEETEPDMDIAARERPLMVAAMGGVPAWAKELLTAKAAQPKAEEPKEEPKPEEPQVTPGEDPAAIEARQRLMGEIEKALKG